MNYPGDEDPELLKKLVLEMATTIYNLTDDPHLKALVNSVFDTYPTKSVLIDLQAFNKGEPMIDPYCESDKL